MELRNFENSSERKRNLKGIGYIFKIYYLTFLILTVIVFVSTVIETFISRDSPYYVTLFCDKSTDLCFVFNFSYQVLYVWMLIMNTLACDVMFFTNVVLIYDSFDIIIYDLREMKINNDMSEEEIIKQFRPIVKRHSATTQFVYEPILCGKFILLFRFMRNFDEQYSLTLLYLITSMTLSMYMCLFFATNGG